MSRGRPRGSKNGYKQSNLFENTEEIFPSVDSTTDINPEENKKPLRVNGYCSCCGKEIYSGLIHISLTSITGNANWSRSCSVDKLVLCNECSKQLNEVVDKWIISKNPNLKKPFCVS